MSDTRYDVIWIVTLVVLVLALGVGWALWM